MLKNSEKRDLIVLFDSLDRCRDGRITMIQLKHLMSDVICNGERQRALTILSTCGAYNEHEIDDEEKNISLFEFIKLFRIILSNNSTHNIKIPTSKKK